MLEEMRQMPLSAWRRIELEGVSREFQTPRILDEKIALKDYEAGPPAHDRRSGARTSDHPGHQPAAALAFEAHRSYAQRMIIENGIADGIDFFHMDALSSAVAMKVNCDLQLTLMGSSLYRLLGAQIGNGYQRAKSRHLFRDFVDATAHITIGAKEISVRFQKRAHNPLLLAAGFDQTESEVPWLGNKRLRLELRTDPLNPNRGVNSIH